MCTIGDLTFEFIRPVSFQFSLFIYLSIYLFIYLSILPHTLHIHNTYLQNWFTWRESPKKTQQILV